MIVAVLSMRMVEMTGHQEVAVIAVGYRFMAAARSMLVVASVRATLVGRRTG